ncbi:hypothetical protein [Frateuria sp.]|uniref:hypothetical protein n=1 Tax=Frateuria sp. TaxID=2211372 RepID=UPI003F7D322C
MRLSSLAKLIAGQLAASDFSSEISEELSVYLRGLQKLGGSAPVVVSEDTDIVLGRVGLSVLCQLFASGQLSAEELAYTADALQLSGRVEFSDDSVADDLAECTDPVINGPFTVARALQIASSGDAA